MKKAVIFDWGGVLIDNPEPAFVHFMSQYFGVGEEVISPVRKRLALDFQRGMQEEEYWRRFCSELGLSVPVVNSSHTKSLWARAFEFAYSPKQEMFQLASDLHRGGYKIALLSNTEMPSVDFFKAQNYEMFDVAVFSCVEGILKPDREIYMITVERLGVSPREAVFIDDKSDYVEGARLAGLNAFLFQSPQQAKTELRNYGKIVQK